MKRTVFSLGVSTVLCLALVACGAVAKETDWDTIVVGVDDPAIDVAAVQAAVDSGGKILLRGTFDFGVEGRVLVLQDGVTLSGERGRKGEYLTTIKGGYDTFLVGQNLPGPIPYGQQRNTVPVAGTTICDILFDASIATSVLVAGATGETTITRNKFTCPKGTIVWGMYCAIPILISYYGEGDPAVVQGEVHITDNVIEGGAIIYSNPEDDPSAVKRPGGYFRGASHGIYLYTIEAHTNIVGNTVRDVFTHGIWLKNMSKSLPMTALVERNDISMPNVGIEGGAAISSDKMGAVHIVNNEISTSHAYAECIRARACDRVVAEGNDLRQEGSKVGAIDIDTDPTHAYIARNTIAGTGMAACCVTKVRGNDAGQNVFVGNRVDAYTPTECHYMLGVGACNNVIIGKDCSIQDEGEGNRCPPHGLVDVIRMRLDARAERRETIRMVQGTQ